MPILNTLLNGFRSAAGAGTRPRAAGPRRRPLLPEVSAGEGAENRRTIDALLKSDADGVVPDIYAEEIGSRGPAGRAYFHDFDRALRRRDPARSDRIRSHVLKRLGADDQARMTLEIRDADRDGQDDRFQSREPGRRRPPDAVPRAMADAGSGGRGSAAPPSQGLIGPGGEGASMALPHARSAEAPPPRPDVERPPSGLIGPGGEGRVEETPPHDDAERLRRVLIADGWSPEEAAARAARQRELLAANADPEDGRVGRLLGTGITEESAREMARMLSPEAIERFIRDWGELAPERRNGLVRLLTAVSGMAGKERLEQFPSGGGIRG